MNQRQITEIRGSFYFMTDKDWPLVRIEFTRNPENMEEFGRFLQDCRDCYSKKEKFVLFVDPSGLSVLSPKYIYGIVNFMNEMEPLTKTYMYELAMLVQSTLVRQIIQCIEKLKNPTIPWYILSDTFEYEEWISNLQERQILFPK